MKLIFFLCVCMCVINAEENFRLKGIWRLTTETPITIEVPTASESDYNKIYNLKKGDMQNKAFVGLDNSRLMRIIREELTTFCRIYEKNNESCRLIFNGSILCFVKYSVPEHTFSPYKGFRVSCNGSVRLKIRSGELVMEVSKSINNWTENRDPAKVRIDMIDCLARGLAEKLKTRVKNFYALQDISSTLNCKPNTKEIYQKLRGNHKCKSFEKLSSCEQIKELKRLLGIED